MTAAKICRILSCCAMALCALNLHADARDDGERGIEEYRKGNLIEGMQLLQQSASAGYTPAQTTLAFILDAAENDAQAFHWYSQAAASGDAAGLFGLGGMYAKGEGTPRDAQKAGELIERAARLEHLVAMRVYAHALEHGQLGFRADPGRAVEWYRKAADAGDERAMRRLMQAYANGDLKLAPNAAEASAWENRIKANRGG